MKDFISVVTDIRLESRTGTAGIWQIALDYTAFRPGDSGVIEAVTRTGTRLSIPVTSIVVDENGTLWHIVEKPLAAGTDVTGRIHSPAGTRLEVAPAP